MKEKFMGHTPMADNNYGLRTVGEVLKQESIAWKIHDKAWFTNVSSDTLAGAQRNHEYHKQLDMRLNDCLKVVLSKETAYATGQLAINVLRLECRKLTQQMRKQKEETPPVRYDALCTRLLLGTKAQPDEVEFCTCGDKRGMGRNDDGSCRDCGGS